MDNGMMKTFLFLLALICCNIQAQDFYRLSGDGTQQSPYIIASLEHLMELAENTESSRGKYFMLNADIRLQGTIQIGNAESPFEGIFDGNSHRIIDLRFYEGNAGLFGYASGATIKRLTVDGGKIVSENGYYGAALIAYAYNTTVENCFVRNIDVIFSGHTGGLTGYAVNTRITDSGYSGSVTGSGQSTGGFIGHAENITVIRCFSEGSVTGSSNTGGFIGKIEKEGDGGENVIEDCYSSSITAGIGQTGGFAGHINTLSTSFSRCYATGSVAGQSDGVGGFLGYGYFYAGERATISDCYSTGNVTGTSDNVGGFVGYARGLTVANCFASGMITGKQQVGGFAGYADSDITNCYAVGPVEGNMYVGGFAGNTAGGNIYECFAAGAVITPQAEGVYHGGFAGSVIYTTFRNCYFDKQGAGLDAKTGFVLLSNIDEIRALSARELTQNSLSGFLPNNWLVTREGYYPQLLNFAAGSDVQTQMRSALSAVPITLQNNEFSSNVKTVFSLTEKTPTTIENIQNILTWTTDPAEETTIMYNKVYGKKSDFWRSLTLRSGSAERTIKFRTAEGLLAAEILGVKINDVTFHDIDEQFIYHIECNSVDMSVFAELILAPYAEITPGSPLRLRANEEIELIARADGKEPKLYRFEAQKHLPSEIFVQRWHDVIAINNNALTNGGYNFVAYYWQKNGIALPDENRGYIRETGGLDKTAVYTAIVTTQEGKTLGVCPAVISEIQSSFSVYPNPVPRGQSVIVSIPAHENGNAIMQMFDQTGNIVSKQPLRTPLENISMPEIPGTYIMQITLNGTAETHKIIVE